MNLSGKHFSRNVPHTAPPANAQRSIKGSSSTLETANNETIATSLDVEAAKNSPTVFRNFLHEMIFIFVVTSAQLITQCCLGNTVFPIMTIAEGLGVADHPSSQSWFVASYSCTVGAFVLVTGRLGDLYGRKNLFLIGWAWLGIFNLAAGFARNHVVFDVMRALSGIGPSVMMPNAAALLAGAWPDSSSKHDQNRKMLAFCIFGAIAPGGYILGAAWGSGITETGLQWGWIYWSLAIVCAGLALAAWVVIPNTPGLNGRGQGTVDYIGSIVGVAGLVFVFVALNGGVDFGWSAPQSPICLVIGVLAIALFCWIETKVAHPILPMSIFQSPTFVAVAISLCAGWMSFGMFQYYNPHFLMEFRHLTPLHVTLQMLPCALIGVVAAVVAIFLLPRVPGYVIFGASMFCFFAGQTLLAFTPVEQSYWAMTFPTTVIICFGPDLSFACSSLIASDKLKPEEQGVAGSFINTIVNYSVAMGLALAGNVESRVNDDGRDRLAGFRGAYYFGMGLGALGMIFTAIFFQGMATKHRA
ncbi:major facilitator superfamily domain-containing protein [Sphaerosporella brunnea]|uniref:Major facilitator superfamily domain-containing protein n=1 Tax=Sphaerosporella brunnea TaxID=1250544 RepID=A0A5J5FAH0_9PEZI|nr:major facilitator superfamily domain-containing protein [Sphaerosporella brunnea]